MKYEETSGVKVARVLFALPLELDKSTTTSRPSSVYHVLVSGGLYCEVSKQLNGADRVLGGKVGTETRGDLPTCAIAIDRKLLLCVR